MGADEVTPGQCNPQGPSPCCSSIGWCGKSDAHCKCTTCVDWRNKWRNDNRCGPNFLLADGVTPGQCNPEGPSPCCSNIGWCGKSDAYCSCPTCFDWSKWRNDNRCGPAYPLGDGVTPAQCNPEGPSPCCSA